MADMQVSERLVCEAQRSYSMFNQRQSEFLSATVKSSVLDIRDFREKISLYPIYPW